MARGVYIRTEEMRKHYSIAKKGKKLPPRSDEFRQKLSKIAKKNNYAKNFNRTRPWNKGKIGVQDYTFRKGCNCNFWKGGISSLSLRIRKSLEYKLWKRAVFERDGFTCVFCGKRYEPFKGHLEADHIKPFALYPELRFAIYNGRILCRECHRKTDSYGTSLFYKYARRHEEK